MVPIKSDIFTFSDKDILLSKQKLLTIKSRRKIKGEIKDKFVIDAVPALKTISFPGCLIYVTPRPQGEAY